MVCACEKKDCRFSHEKDKKHLVEGMRSRERPKKTWDEQIKDLSEMLFSENLIRIRNSWRHHIHILDC